MVQNNLELENCTIGRGSYTDVYDFCSKKQFLKKWEIELRQKVAEYCDNDVLATEAAFNNLKED